MQTSLKQFWSLAGHNRETQKY